MMGVRAERGECRLERRKQKVVSDARGGGETTRRSRLLLASRRRNERRTEERVLVRGGGNLELLGSGVVSLGKGDVERAIPKVSVASTAAKVGDENSRAIPIQIPGRRG